MKYFERRRERKLKAEAERAREETLVPTSDENPEVVATVEVDVSNDMTAGVINDITREIEKLPKETPKTSKQVRRGFPNEEIRHYRHLCPFCKMGWDDAREYQRAVCERTGYPHSDPRHVETTRGIELRRKAR